MTNFPFGLKQYLLPLFVIFTISCSPLKDYRQSSEIARWEADVIRFEETDRQESYPDNSVLFAGSSSIRLWKSLADDMAPYPVIQRGYGGASLSDFAVYADRIIYPHRYSGIVLFIANDISGNDTDKSPRQVLRLFKQVVKSIRTEFPQTPVFWIAITPTESRWDVWPEIRTANDLIRNYCMKNPETYFIATEHEFLNDMGNPRSELFLDDRLHLNESGYAVWSEIIRNELDKVLAN